MSTNQTASPSRYAFVLYLLLLALFSLNSSGAEQRIDKSYLHQSWQYDEGLPQNAVQAVIQTSDGYIWTATPRGLARFDGVRFTIFDSGTTPELISPHITAFCEAKDKTLWIGTENGLIALKDGKFTRHASTNDVLGPQIRTLYETKDGVLWIGTVTGLSQLKEGKFRLFAPNGWPKNIACRSVLQDQEGAIWLGTSPGGLFKWKDNILTSYNFDRTELVWGRGKGLPNDTTRVVYQDRRKNLWVGSNQGLTLFRENNCFTFKTWHGLADSIISSIFEDSDGNLWVGSYGGLNRLDPGDFDRLLTVQTNETNAIFQVEINSEGNAFDLVNSICQDYEGNIWVAGKDGLNRLKPRRFTSYTRSDGLSHNNVTSVRESRKGGLWVGTWGGGLNYFHEGSFTNLTPALVLGVHEDETGVWYGADYDAGLYEFNETGHARWGKTNGLTDYALRVIYREPNKDMWIGTTTALVLFRNGKFTRFTKKQGLAGDLVRAIIGDPQGNLWIGTSGGLSLRRDGIFRNFTTANGLSTNAISGLYKDNEDNLWIATLGGGLNRYKNGRFTTYRESQGLHTDELFEIVEDDFGNLWLTSRFGVFRVSKKELNDFDQGKVKALKSTFYGKHDGMVSVECSAVAKPAAWKTRDGKLWFATSKGLVVINPYDNLQNAVTNPPIVVEQVLHDGIAINPAGLKVRLPPGRGEMEFHYAALSYTEPLKNRFKYMLEGVDETWIDAGTRRQTYYSKLPPGDYVFRVKGCNSDGVWNEAGAAFPFRLEPRFYETKLFLILSSCGFIFSVAGIQFFRARHLRARHRQLEALVEERTRHLDEKTKHLSAEIAQREQMQLEMERVQKELLNVSRIAGMAEVAAGILHNVGNVLNSASVSATLLYDRIRKSRVSNLTKIAHLLREQEANLGNFFTSDERGKQLPSYMERLSEHCTSEQTENIKEIEGLRGSLEHIKSIIVLQQSYGGVSGFTEAFDLCQLIEEGLRLTGPEMARHSVVTLRELEPTPKVVSDKHKVLQIVVNMLKNAGLACRHSSQNDKRVVIRTRSLDNNKVEIVVIDNGVGISPENLPKLFTQGFTTRAEGHGLGLHTSMLLAKQLGGTMTVESPGVGKGATFRLELPLTSNSR